MVLSGGSIETERFAGLDPAIARKAQLPLLGRPMVEWVVRALRAAEGLGRVVVVGHPDLATPGLRELAVELVPEAGGITENLRAGLEPLRGSERVLLVSGDLPLLTAAAVEDFLHQAPDADVVFPYVAREDALREFGDREWMFARTPDGYFTGCSAALFRPEAVFAQWKWVDQALSARRRSVLGLALLIGLPMAVKYALGRLRVRDVEARVSALLHLRARGYRTRYTELAMDVDKYTDIAFVEEILRGRAR